MDVKDTRRIVICGASIYVLAIETGLSAMVEGDIVRINPDFPDTIERINLLEPHVVIMERNGKNNQLTQEMMSQSIPLIVLDEAQRSLTVLAGEHPPTAEINELTYVIEMIKQQQFEKEIGRW